ncbi:MAG TPA: glycosyltransferase family protein [Longimicrobiaceae bacterium]|nr:glycosyltransferase family protein [Longimicrobiaceae bacterium]
MPRVVASIEARMGSSRLPGKVLMDVGGVPALGRLARRLRRSEMLDDVVLATSTSPADDELEAWARAEGIAVHRGSEDDVLLRVVEAQRKMSSEVVVEVTGDCTLLDPELVDMGVRTFLGNECDVVHNVRDLSFPMGMDVQVFRLRDLEEVERTVDDPAVREHVSLYFYEHPERYRAFQLFAPRRWHAPGYRFQLDYPEDLRFIREVYARLEPEHGDAFGIEEIMALLRAEPWLVEINRHCEEKSVR